MPDHKKYHETTHILRIVVAAVLVFMTWILWYWMAGLFGFDHVAQTIVASAAGFLIFVGYALLLSSKEE